MISTKLLALGGTAALLVGIGVGWTLRDWKADADQLAALEKAQAREDEARKQAEGQATDYEEGRSDEQARTIERQSELRTIYRDVPVPADCAVPAAAVGVLESARTRANARASGEPRSAVSADPGDP